MSVLTEKICIEALSLPSGARAELAHRLLISLEGEDFADDVSEAWQGEINFRRQDFSEGKTKEVSEEEAQRRAEAVIG